jgi:tRNA-Thr(GGU) m(6)t(6)A37 methyltransferase TsaA
MENIIFSPIGVIHSPFKELKGMPIQPRKSGGAEATIEIYEKYIPALDDLDGFSHIYLLFHLHLSNKYDLKVIPFLDTQKRGLFSTRAPRRPNPIGLSIVNLQKIEKNILYIKDIDIIDGTPLLDIKPYVHSFDKQTDIKIGWLEGKIDDADIHRADNRFDDSK